MFEIRERISTEADYTNRVVDEDEARRLLSLDFKPDVVDWIIGELKKDLSAQVFIKGGVMRYVPE